jgi:DNA adenine methylase
MVAKLSEHLKFRPPSVLRYPGGKDRVRSLLRHYRPLGCREYREALCGGASLFFEIGFAFERAWLNDLHAGLIAFYSALRDRPGEFIAGCRSIEPARPDDPMTKRGPRGGAPKNARLKAVFDELKLNEDCDQALRYFFVNRTVHGSGRVNYDIPSRLYFSNPAGWNIVDTDALEQAAGALRDVRLSCRDYSVLLETPGDDVFVYCDSPYVVNGHLDPTAQLYQFNFAEEDHRRFAEVVRNCRHKVMVSYDDDPDGLVRELFPASDYWIEELGWPYAGTTSAVKKIGRELLICNYRPPVWDVVHRSHMAS